MTKRPNLRIDRQLNVQVDPQSDNMDVRVPMLSNLEWNIERTQEHSLLVLKNALQLLHTFKGVLLSAVLIAKILVGYIYTSRRWLMNEWV